MRPSLLDPLFAPATTLDGRFLYVPIHDEGRVDVIDTTRGEVVDRLGGAVVEDGLELQPFPTSHPDTPSSSAPSPHRDAEAVPGVALVLTHQNRPPVASYDEPYEDDDAADGSPFRPLFNDRILYSGQPVALVVADNLELARYAGSLLKVEYAAEPHRTDLLSELETMHKAPAELPPPATPAPAAARDPVVPVGSRAAAQAGGGPVRRGPVRRGRPGPPVPGRTQ